MMNCDVFAPFPFPHLTGCENFGGLPALSKAGHRDWLAAVVHFGELARTCSTSAPRGLPGSVSPDRPQTCPRLAVLLAGNSASTWPRPPLPRRKEEPRLCCFPASRRAPEPVLFSLLPGPASQLPFTGHVCLLLRTPASFHMAPQHLFRPLRFPEFCPGETVRYCFSFRLFPEPHLTSLSKPTETC